jgi:hypothetical protein
MIYGAGAGALHQGEVKSSRPKVLLLIRNSMMGDSHGAHVPSFIQPLGTNTIWTSTHQLVIPMLAFAKTEVDGLNTTGTLVFAGIGAMVGP